MSIVPDYKKGIEGMRPMSYAGQMAPLGHQHSELALAGITMRSRGNCASGWEMVQRRRAEINAEDALRGRSNLRYA